MIRNASSEGIGCTAAGCECCVFAYLGMKRSLFASSFPCMVFFADIDLLIRFDRSTASVISHSEGRDISRRMNGCKYLSYRLPHTNGITDLNPRLTFLMPCQCFLPLQCSLIGIQHCICLILGFACLNTFARGKRAVCLLERCDAKRRGYLDLCL